MEKNFIKLINLANKSDLITMPPEKRIFTDFIKKFSINKYQGALFIAILVSNFENKYSTSLQEIRDEFGVNNNTYIKMLKDLKVLYKKGLVTIERGRRGNFLANPDVEIDENTFSYLLTGVDMFEDYNFKDIFSIVDLFSNLVEQLSEEKISHDRFYTEINRMIKRIDKRLISLNQIVNSYSDKEIIMIFYAIKDYLLGGDGIRMSMFSDEVFKEIRDKAKYNRLIVEEQLFIIKDKIIEIRENGFLMNDPEFRLTEKTVRKLFKTKRRGKKKEKFISSKLEYKNSVQLNKKLFLNSDIEIQLDLLKNSIELKNFKQITKKLRKSGFPEGIVALFHGAPGTGKTASAHRLSFLTKRDILQVDISAIRDKWVGNSEKNIKKIFSEYERAKDELNRIPILLFNEADALISKRIGIGDSVDQMNNTMQNILLEQLENFKGIFIATTNMVKNIDDAFSRRFLFKIEFTKPDQIARQNIWMDKLPNLRRQEYDQLVKYELTGAQIENISRKYMLNSILNLKELKITDLIKMAKDELSFKRNKKNNPIGFIDEK